MKKAMSLLLCALLLMLCACGSVSDLYIHRGTAEPTPTAAAPASEATPAPEPTPKLDLPPLLGEPVLVSVEAQSFDFFAPDGSGQRILSFSYDCPRVSVGGSRAVTDAINDALAVLDEQFYSGTGAGDGLNAMLEQATDNFTVAYETGAARNLEFTCSRTVSVPRADSRVLSLRLLTHSYTGGAHGTYFERAYVFDLENGALLTLDDLSADRAALEAAVLDALLAQIEADVLYSMVPSYVETMTGQSLSEALSALLREGSWLLSGEGLELVSDLYELAGYADGLVRFTVPYAALEGLLDARFLPVPRQGEGALRVLHGDELPQDVEILDRVALSEGQQVFLLAEGPVYDLSVSSVIYIDGSGFYDAGLRWRCSYLGDAAVQLETVVPEGMPNLLLSYTDQNGAEQRWLLAESCLDGSYLLIEESSIETVG